MGRISRLRDVAKINFPIAGQKKGLIAARLEGLLQRITQHAPLHLLVIQGKLNGAGRASSKAELENHHAFRLSRLTCGRTRDSRPFSLWRQMRNQQKSDQQYQQNINERSNVDGRAIFSACAEGHYLLLRI